MNIFVPFFLLVIDKLLSTFITLPVQSWVSVKGSESNPAIICVFSCFKKESTDRDTIDAESALRIVPGIVHEVIYSTAGLNSCLNPLLYGAYYYSKIKNRSSTQASQRHIMTSTEIWYFFLRLIYEWLSYWVCRLIYVRDWVFRM